MANVAGYSNVPMRIRYRLLLTGGLPPGAARRGRTGYAVG